MVLCVLLFTPDLDTEEHGSHPGHILPQANMTPCSLPPHTAIFIYGLRLVFMHELGISFELV